MERILVVESDPQLAVLLEEGFRANGYEISTVADGSSARGLAEAGECDLVVVDGPRLARDELQALRRSADHRRLPVVLMTMPFQFDVLLAHVRGRLERSLKLDPWTRSVRMGGADIALTGREFALLEFLLRHPRQVLTREQLHVHVWGYQHDPGSNVIEVYVGYLRRKLGAELIETVHGQGYRLKI